MNDRSILALVAILSLTVLESVALACGHDGILFTVVVGAVCGLAGYEIRGVRDG